MAPGLASRTRLPRALRGPRQVGEPSPTLSWTLASARALRTSRRRCDRNHCARTSFTCYTYYRIRRIRQIERLP